MCSLAVILRDSSRFPLVVAANRDESRERSTRAPFLWEGSPRRLAGRDEERGGTWLGVNEGGVFVAITNLWGRGPRDPRRASRGELVARLLGCPDLEGAAARLEEENPEATNPCILVCADRGGEGFWTSTEHELRLRPLRPGVHAFGNRLPGEPENRAAEAELAGIGAAWSERREAAPDRLVAALGAALSRHASGEDPRDGVCVHTKGVHGTVSSSILLAAPGGAESRFVYAPGPPCVTPYRDLTALLRELWKGD